MKLLEKILVGFFAIALSFKLMYWPGANIFLILSVGALSLFYTTKYVYNQNDSSGKQYKIAFATGNLYAITLVGFLFKIMFWPGGTVAIIVACLGLLISLIIIFLEYRQEDKKKYYAPILYRTLIMFLFSFVVYKISNKDLYAYTHKNDPIGIELYNKMSDNPTNSQYKEEFIQHVRRK